MLKAKFAKFTAALLPNPAALLPNPAALLANALPHSRRQQMPLKPLLGFARLKQFEHYR